MVKCAAIILALAAPTMAASSVSSLCCTARRLPNARISFLRVVGPMPGMSSSALLVWRFNWESAIPNAFSVIGHDDTLEPCSMLYTDERGVARIYQMSLDGGVWKQWRDSPGFSQRMTGIFSADGKTITGHGELSRDGSTWEGDLDVTYTRKS